MTREIYLGKLLGLDRYIGIDREPYIIAEIGGSHDGNIEKAKAMIQQAALAGADCVKFQIFRTEDLFNEKDAAYPAVRGYKTQYERMKSIELPRESFKELCGHARKFGIHFSASAWDKEAIDYLVDELKAPFVKVGSGDITAVPLLLHIATKKVPVFLSTAGATEEMISQAVKIIGRDRVVVMHCTFPYPTRHEDVNMYRMVRIAEKFGTLVGYSDHTTDISACVGAAYMGASVIEVHFSTNRGYKCTGDHKVSAEVEELKELVKLAKRAQWHKGESTKTADELITQDAMTFGEMARRSIKTKTNIKKGSAITEKNVIIIRPENKGIPASKYYEVLGKKAKRDIKEGTFLQEGDI